METTIFDQMNDFNKSRKINTNVAVKSTKQSISDRKEAANDLNVKFMSAKNRIEFLLKEVKMPSVKKAMESNNLTVKDFTVKNLLHCYTAIKILTDSGEYVIRVKLVKFNPETSVHVNKSEFLPFVNGATKVTELSVNFSVLDVNYKVIETSNGDFYFVKKDVVYTFEILSDYSKITFLQLFSKLATYKERAANYEKRELLKKQLENEMLKEKAKEQINDVNEPAA